jgi:hypothetical protein
MSKFNNGRSYHGSDEISDGRLKEQLGQLIISISFAPNARIRKSYESWSMESTPKNRQMNTMQTSKARQSMGLLWCLKSTARNADILIL